MTAQAWVTLTVGLVGIVGAILTIRQRTLADRERTAADKRAEWWRRTQWALDQTHNQDHIAARHAGWAVLNHVVISPLMSGDDKDLLQSVARSRRAPHTGVTNAEEEP